MSWAACVSGRGRVEVVLFELLAYFPLLMSDYTCTMFPSLYLHAIYLSASQPKPAQLMPLIDFHTTRRSFNNTFSSWCSQNHLLFIEVRCTGFVPACHNFHSRSINKGLSRASDSAQCCLPTSDLPCRISRAACGN